MSTSLDDELRAGLRAWADEVRASPGDPFDAMIRPPTGLRPFRGRAVVWAGTAAAATALTFAVAHTRDPSPVVGPAATTIAPAPETPLRRTLPPIVLPSADSGWHLDEAIARAEGGDAHLIFVHADTRWFQIGALATAPPGSVPHTGGRPVTVRGQTGHLLENESRSPIIRWWEMGREWYARTGTGNPDKPSRQFDSTDDFLATLDDLEVVDQASWEDWLPDELAAFLHDRPDATSVVWNADRGIDDGTPTTSTMPGR
jgi:hypothetical protein